MAWVCAEGVRVLALSPGVGSGGQYAIQVAVPLRLATVLDRNCLSPGRNCRPR